MRHSQRLKERHAERQMEPETRESRSVSDARVHWMIIDPLFRQLERSVPDSTVQRHAERREEGQVEMFPLPLERVST